MRCLSQLLPCLLLINLQGQSYDRGEGPPWLFSLDTPEGLVLAIGHAPKYVDTDRGFKEARESGYEKLASQFVVHVEHRLTDVQVAGRIGSREYMVVTTDPIILQQVRNACVALDSAIIDDGTYILLATARNSGNLDVEVARTNLSNFYLQKTNRKKPPPWTRSLVATPTRAIGAGRGRRTIGENEYLAMKDAFVSLAASRSTQVFSQLGDHQKTNRRSGKTIYETEVDTTIYHARIIKRWYLQSSRDYFIMISTE